MEIRIIANWHTFGIGWWVSRCNKHWYIDAQILFWEFYVHAKPKD